MYITPDLFTTDKALLDTHRPSRTVQVTYEFQPSVLGKRRRTACEKVLDLPPYALEGNETVRILNKDRRPKQQLRVDEHDSDESRFGSRSLSLPPPESKFGYDLERTWHEVQQRIPPTTHRRRMLPMKRQVLQTIESPKSLPNTPLISQPILTPCHVCYKAPKLKSELDGFEDCWRCQERTCFICMRQCQTGCNERKICRQCCVEQGEDGVVCCLDCLQRSQDEEMEG